MAETMRVEMLETVKHGREQFVAGDVRVVPKDVGEYFCGCGWAKDTGGAVPTAARDTSRKVLAPDTVVQKLKAGEVG